MAVPGHASQSTNGFQNGSAPQDDTSLISQAAGNPRIVLTNGKTRQVEDTPPSTPELAIAVDPVALVTTECITVTSAMRKHARWAQSSVSAILGGTSYRGGTAGPPGPKPSRPPSRRQSGRLSVSDVPLAAEEDVIASRWGLRGRKGRSLQDNPLMSAFSRLRSDIKDCNGLLHRCLNGRF